MLSLVAGLLGCLLAASASAALTAGAVYDENDRSANVVDRSAAFLGGSGAGNNPGLVPDVRSFAFAAATAFQNGFGGVVDFEAGVLDTPLAFTVLFSGGAKSLVIQQNSGSGWSIKSYVNEVRTPVSGTRALAKEMGSPNFEFTLSSLIGGATNEHVVALGLTLLGRNNSNARSSWTGVAFLQDPLGNTGTVTNRIANLNTGNGNATDDAFFGFRAPAGYFIAGVLIFSDNGAFTALDDLAFITAAVADPVVAAPPPPPPAAPVQSVPASPVPPAVEQGGFGAEWWIVGALGVIILLLLGLILALKRFGRQASLLPDRLPSGSFRAAPAQPVVTVRPGIERGQIPAELTEFAKQELVQGLYSQRQALMETQKLAEQRLAELEKWLSQLHLPLQDRIRAYEDRIAELEKELATKDESVRELTRATLLLVRRKLEEEKERERSFSRFS